MYINSAGQNSINIDVGSVDVNSIISEEEITIGSSTLTLGSGYSSFRNGLNMGTGSALILGSGNVDISGNSTWNDATLDGSGTGDVTNLGSLSISGSNTFTNVTLINQNEINVVFATVSNFFSSNYTNDAGATFNMVSATFAPFGPLASHQFANNGTLSANTSNGNSTLGMTLTNNGNSGVVSASGFGGGSLTLDAVTNLSGGTLSGGIWSAAGTTLVFPGNITTNAATLEINSIGMISAPANTSLGPTLITNGNNGSVSFTGSTSFTLEDDFSNFGALFIETGSTLEVANISGSGYYTQNWSNSTTTVDGTLIAAAMFINNGTLTGNGDIDVNIDADLQGAATLDPGGIGTTGSLTFTDADGFMEDGALNIQIGGTGAGQFDQILGGFSGENNTLNISVVNGYTPSPSGDTFIIIEDFVPAGFTPFTNVSEGSVLNVGGIDFVVSFVGGVGANDLTLTAQSTALGVTNLNDSGVGSLRQAILDSNSSVGITNTIDFTGLPAGVVINLLSALPQITDSVTINGYTASGASPNTLSVGSDAVIGVTLNGGTIGAASIGLDILASNTEIRGLSLVGFGNGGITGGTNILINAAANNVTIAGNHIGVNAAGTAADGALRGVEILGGSGHVIGGSFTSDRNVISGNDNGIISFGTSASVKIQNNYIGTDAHGTTDFGNGSSGVELNGTHTLYVIGGPGAEEGNVISGNNSDGIRLTGAGVNNIEVYNNHIGVNADGDAIIGNDGHGIFILGGANNNSIGGGSIATRNIISGNVGAGISLAIGSDGNTISGNFIGTDTNGTGDLGNLNNGIIALGSQ